MIRNEDPTVEGPLEATPDGVVEEDAAPLEHDDDALLCADDCVGDEEHMSEVVPGTVAEVVPERNVEALPFCPRGRATPTHSRAMSGAPSGV